MGDPGLDSGQAERETQNGIVVRIKGEKPHMPHPELLGGRVGQKHHKMHGKKTINLEVSCKITVNYAP